MTPPSGPRAAATAPQYRPQAGGGRGAPQPTTSPRWPHANQRRPNRKAAALPALARPEDRHKLYPAQAEASREIERLKKLSGSPRHERAHDRRAVSKGLATGTSDARVREDEVDGYGSNCRWLR